MRTLRSFIVGTAAIVLALACGGDHGSPTEPPPPRNGAGIKIIAGGAISDTISAILSVPLTVEIRDSAGQLVQGTPVRFSEIPVKAPNGYTYPSAYVEALDANSFEVFAAPVTDGQGRAGVFVRLGTVIGQAQIEVSAPAYGYADTVSLGVTPGAPASLSFQPSDTGITVGGTAQLRAAVVDRAGNPRPDPVTYDPLDGTIATITSTGKVTGVAIGAQSITAHVGTVSKSGTVEVVPNGTIAAYYGGGYYTGGPDSTGINILNLDGSHRQWIVRVGGSSEGLTAPVWAAGGDLIYTGPQASNVSTSRLFEVTPGRTPALLNPSGTPNGSVEAWPEYNAATGRTYYSAHTGSNPWQVYWRLADGTVANISPEPAGTLTWRPSPSPDGTKFAYITVVNYSAAIKVYDLTTGTMSSWSVPGQIPTWSPKGDRIAYVPSSGGHIFVMNVDGSDSYAVGTGFYQEQPFSWSPDGKWIIAKEAAGPLDLIEVGSGTTIKLGYLSDYYYPAWK